MHGERKRPKPYIGYVALLSNIIDKEPSNCKEDVENKKWKDVVIMEYHSIVKNDV